MSKRLIAGNWKMHGRLVDLEEARLVANGSRAHAAAVDVAICPPFPYIKAFADAVGDTIIVGAQTIDHRADGAFTGCVSAGMAADVGATCAILGHSERRRDFAETDPIVAAQARAAAQAGLLPIVCVGETLEERLSGAALEVVRGQVLGSVPEGFSGPLAIAYEPVWAIGSGRVASPEDILEMHETVRRFALERLAPSATLRVLYGGSVKPENAEQILNVAGVDGALVGGACLKAESFLQIIDAAARSSR